MKVIKGLQRSLQELIVSLFNKEISDTEVLRELNTVVCHNNNFKPFIYELFFSEALKIDKVPHNQFLLMELFKRVDDETFLVRETVKTESVRLKVLAKLNLLTSKKLYKEYLTWIEPESHVWYKKGVNDPDYQRAIKKRTSLEQVREAILKECSGR